MTTSPVVISKKYKKRKAYVRIKGVIRNPVTALQKPLDFECRIDTGFDGGVLVPHWLRSDAQSIKVEPRVTNMTLADGSKTIVYVCAAYIQSIDKHIFSPPGKPVRLIMCGNRKGKLLGMDALEYCSILFNGPKQAFTISF